MLHPTGTAFAFRGASRLVYLRRNLGWEELTHYEYQRILQATVDYLKVCARSALVGAAPQTPRRVNVNWGHYTEDNGFGTHEFIGFCKLIGAEPYFAANVGSDSPREFRDWNRVLQLS